MLVTYNHKLARTKKFAFLLAFFFIIGQQILSDYCYQNHKLFLDVCIQYIGKAFLFMLSRSESGDYQFPLYHNPASSH